MNIVPDYIYPNNLNFFIELFVLFRKCDFSGSWFSNGGRISIKEFFIIKHIKTIIDLIDLIQVFKRADDNIA